MASFPSIRIEGGLLGPELLDQVIAADVPGQKPADFGLEPKRNLTDEIAAAFADSRAQWGIFKNRLARLPADNLATTETRKQWVEPFLSLIGFNAQPNPRAFEVDGQTFAVSHRGGEAEDAPPVHIVGAPQELGRVPPNRRPRLAPHSLLQECLKLLGNGFLTHSDNEELRQKLNSHQLPPTQFYRQLLRLVYRFLFLLVSEDRGLISPNPVYRDYYSIARLRRMLDVRAAWTDHPDLWLSLRTLFTLFQDDKLSAVLDLAPLNGELFATQTL